MKRKLDMYESSNIKCEHCRFWQLEQNGQDHKEEMYRDGFIAGLAAGATEFASFHADKHHKDSFYSESWRRDIMEEVHEWLESIRN